MAHVQILVEVGFNGGSRVGPASQNLKQKASSVMKARLHVLSVDSGKLRSHRTAYILHACRAGDHRPISVTAAVGSYSRSYGSRNYNALRHDQKP